MAEINKAGGTILVKYISTLTDTNEKIIRRKVRGKMLLELADLKIVDTYFDTKGKEHPDKCKVYHAQIGWLYLNEPFDEINKLKMDGTVHIAGFQQKKKPRTKLIKPNTKKQ